MIYAGRPMCVVGLCAQTGIYRLRYFQFVLVPLLLFLDRAIFVYDKGLFVYFIDLCICLLLFVLFTFFGFPFGLRKEVKYYHHDNNSL